MDAVLTIAEIEWLERISERPPIGRTMRCKPQPSFRLWRQYGIAADLKQKKVTAQGLMVPSCLKGGLEVQATLTDPPNRNLVN